MVRVDGKDCWYRGTNWTATRLGIQRRLEEGTNGVASDKPSNFSPLEVSNSAFLLEIQDPDSYSTIQAHQVPLTNPYPKGSAEAIRVAKGFSVAMLQWFK